MNSVCHERIPRFQVGRITKIGIGLAWEDSSFPNGQNFKIEEHLAQEDSSFPSGQNYQD